MANFSSFTNYNRTVSGITYDLKKLREFSRKLKLEGNASAIDEVLKRLDENTFRVAIVGEFKRGKSTLINALLARDVLPMDVLPTTATLNKIVYDIDKFVELNYKDGRSEKIDIDRLNDYVTKLTKESEERAKTIREATVHYPVPYCKHGITIIDTPGLNDDEAMTEVTMGVLPQIDAALMVIMAQAPFSESERDFLESKIITSDLGRVLFVVTGIDQLDEGDDSKVLLNIAGRIQEHVITKARHTYGEDSPEFETYKRKIGTVRVHGLSAKKALKAKLKNDDDMLKLSRFPEFEAELERFLTEDRGAIALSVPVNRIKTSSIELAKAIQLRGYALTARKDEFNEKCEQAMAEIENIKGERKVEFDRINEAAERTKVELEGSGEIEGSIKGYWPALEKAAMDTIRDYPIESLGELNEQATIDKIAAAVQDAISTKGQFLAERIQAAIETALGGEAEKFSGFEKSFYAATERIQGLFADKSAAASGGNVGGTVFSTVGNYFSLGLGSAYTGFKDAGWKGALLGGATGAAGTLGTGVGISLLLGALAITAWPVMLIGGLGAGLAGHFTSKWAVGKFFLGVKIGKFKDSFRDKVLAEFNKMYSDNTFRNNVYTQVETAFNALKEKIKTETDNILGDMQNMFDQTKVESVKVDIEGKNEREELNQMLAAMDEICARAEEIGKQITEVLYK
jgi:hypothetical protein